MEWEFDCAECKRHIIRFAPPNAKGLPRCAECQHLPGWYLDPEIRNILDPGYEVMKPEE